MTGNHIIVKDNNEGKKFVTLDGEEHTLGEHDLAICNEEEPMCIAGVFGGKGSGTYETTKNVVLESAYFHPTWIRKSARRHGLSTDASFRFERGIDPEGTIYALKQAAILCKELAGGKVSMEICDEYPNPIAPAKVSLKYDYVDNLIGKKIGNDTIKSIVTSLEMAIDAEDAEGLELSVPAYRVDVQRPCDVVEDILRIYGYNNVEIPTQLKSSLVIKGEEDKKLKMQNLVAEQLVGAGFREILCNSLTKSAYYDGLESVPSESLVNIMNPLSSDLNVMRGTLLFGGLEAIVRNANRKYPNLRFFEVGNLYEHSKDKQDDENPMRAYKEENYLGLWMTGKSIEGSWAHKDEKMSFYHLRATVDNIFARVGLTPQMTVIERSNSDLFSAALKVMTRGGKVLCEMGIVSKKIQKKFEIQNEVYFAQINWTQLCKAVKKHSVHYQEISKFPAVSRDLSLLIDSNIEFAQIVSIARNTEKKLLKSVELFDVYEGDKLPEGKKSYAVNFILQDAEKTLNDKAIDAIMNKLITNLKKQLGAELR